jgi:hypothetical protein
MDLDYVLPLRWRAHDPAALAELTAYLRGLAGHARVTVVDGSPPEVFARHAAAWAGLGVAHLPPDADLRFANGKVNGVHTGLRRAAREHVVIADDDVRWTRAGLERARALLAGADLVRPQNVFDPMPWHARWDTGRSLLNRAAGADWPGTFALRRGTFEAMGGYDGDVLFENLELVRTVRAHGGRVRHAPDLYVRRLPPAAGHFRSQRVRQAYDGLAQPVRLAAELAVLPAVGLALARRRPGAVLAGVGAVVAAAEVGRRRAGGAAVFPPDTPLWAPLWLAERAVCAWLAVGTRVVHGGVRYGDGRLRTAAHSTRALRRVSRLLVDADGVQASSGKAEEETISGRSATTTTQPDRLPRRRRAWASGVGPRRRGVGRHALRARVGVGGGGEPAGLVAAVAERLA